MPNITLLPTITSVTNATTFVIVDNRLTKRVNYSSFLNQISTDLLAVGFRGNTGNTGTNGVGVIAGGTVNQVLAKIDASDYESDLLDAQASIASAQASLVQERANAKVAEKEWAQISNGTPTDLSLRKPQLAQEIARLKSAEAGLHRAERNLERTIIRAPSARSEIRPDKEPASND